MPKFFNLFHFHFHFHLALVVLIAISSYGMEEDQSNCNGFKSKLIYFMKSKSDNGNNNLKINVINNLIDLIIDELTKKELEELRSSLSRINFNNKANSSEQQEQSQKRESYQVFLNSIATNMAIEGSNLFFKNKEIIMEILEYLSKNDLSKLINPLMSDSNDELWGNLSTQIKENFWSKHESSLLKDACEFCHKASLIDCKIGGAIASQCLLCGHEKFPSREQQSSNPSIAISLTGIRGEATHPLPYKHHEPYHKQSHSKRQFTEMDKKEYHRLHGQHLLYNESVEGSYPINARTTNQSQDESSPPPKRFKGNQLVSTGSPPTLSDLNKCISSFQQQVSQVVPYISLAEGKLVRGDDGKWYQVIMADNNKKEFVNLSVSLEISARFFCETELVPCRWEHYNDHHYSEQIFSVIAKKEYETRDTGSIEKRRFEHAANIINASIDGEIKCSADGLPTDQQDLLLWYQYSYPDSEKSFDYEEMRYEQNNIQLVHDSFNWHKDSSGSIIEIYEVINGVYCDKGGTSHIIFKKFILPEKCTGIECFEKWETDEENHISYPIYRVFVQNFPLAKRCPNNQKKSNEFDRYIKEEVRKNPEKHRVDKVISASIFGSIRLLNSIPIPQQIINLKNKYACPNGNYYEAISQEEKILSLEHSHFQTDNDDDPVNMQTYQFINLIYQDNSGGRHYVLENYKIQQLCTYGEGLIEWIHDDAHRASCQKYMRYIKTCPLLSDKISQEYKFIGNFISNPQEHVLVSISSAFVKSEEVQLDSNSFPNQVQIINLVNKYKRPDHSFYEQIFKQPHKIRLEHNYFITENQDSPINVRTYQVVNMIYQDDFSNSHLSLKDFRLPQACTYYEEFIEWIHDDTTHSSCPKYKRYIQNFPFYSSQIGQDERYICDFNREPQNYQLNNVLEAFINSDVTLDTNQLPDQQQFLKLKKNYIRPDGSCYADTSIEIKKITLEHSSFLTENQNDPLSIVSYQLVNGNYNDGFGNIHQIFKNFQLLQPCTYHKKFVRWEDDQNKHESYKIYDFFIQACPFLSDYLNQEQRYICTLVRETQPHTIVSIGYWPFNKEAYEIKHDNEVIRQYDKK